MWSPYRAVKWLGTSRIGLASGMLPLSLDLLFGIYVSVLRYICREPHGTLYIVVEGTDMRDGGIVRASATGSTVQ